MFSGDEGSFLLLKGEEYLSQYQLGTLAAKHYFCSTYGVYTHHKPRSKPNIFRVNAGCIEEIDPLSMPSGVFDGLSV